MHDMVSVQRDILFLLAANGGCSGKKLGQKLKDYRKGGLNTDSIYPHLDTLLELRFIEKTKDGRYNRYSLTERGVREIKVRISWQDKLLSEHDAFEFDSEDESPHKDFDRLTA